MDTKNNINHLFNDDFSDLFNEDNLEMEVENSQESIISTYLKILEEEVNVQKKLESIQNLAKVIPKISILVVDKKIFQYLLPAVKDLLINIFKETEQNDNLKILQQYLQMCIEIHEVLNTIMDYVLQNENVTLYQIQNLPSSMLSILLITFQHCKSSDKVYENYIENLKEIVLLFKVAQEIHTKFLKLLENHININEVLQEEEIILLKNVLDVLGEIGEVLVDMNLKALADNWKSYMNVTQNFAEVLNNNSYDISKPLSFLSIEISKNLKLILNMDITDAKSINQNLKLCNFFIRVALKLCEIFWPGLKRICASVLNFLSTMYNFFPPFLQFKGCHDNMIAQINSSIFNCAEQLLNKILCQPEFFTVASKINLKETQSPGLLFLFITIFQKLPTIANTILNNCNVYLIIEKFFEIVKNSYSEFFWRLRIPVEGEQQQQSLYDECVINLTLTVLSLNSKEYDQIQLILFKNILQEQIWGALLAIDVWCLILRKNPPQLCYETLIQTIEKTEPILLNNNSIVMRPETIFLENFIQRIYMSLPEEYKSNLVEKYAPLHNDYLWKILTFKSFPETHLYVIESFLINLIEKIELLKTGRCNNVNDFDFLCNGFEIISSLSEKNKIDLNYIQTMIVKLWDFKADKNLHNNALFKNFINKLCRATWNFVNFFDNKQMAMVLPKVNQMLNSNLDFKIQALQMLNALSSKHFQESPEKNQLIYILSEIFGILLKTENPIIREASLEIFVNFLNTTPHEVIVQQAVKNEDGLQKMISNYIQKHVVQDCKTERNVISDDVYYQQQKNYKFKHVCLKEETNLCVKKTSKVDTDEVNMLVKRIKNDVISLHRLFGKTNVSEENCNEILNVLSRQIDYKI